MKKKLEMAKLDARKLRALDERDLLKVIGGDSRARGPKVNDG